MFNQDQGQNDNQNIINIINLGTRSESIFPTSYNLHVSNPSHKMQKKSCKNIGLNIFSVLHLK